MGYKDLSREELIMLVDRLVEEKRRRRYGLVWEEQEEGVEKILRGNYPVLAEVKEREIINDKAKPMNLLIEGDNLHSLNTLLYTHREKVNVIYIDPPYNTGNKDFVYNDKMVDKEDTWRHSKWLSFMAKRLRIAKELLSDDGVIFISIDDNEQAQLKLLCDEIFGEENFVSNLVWENNRTGRQLSKYFAETKEYILVYKKGEFDVNREEVKEDSVIKGFKHKDEKGYFKKGDPLFNNNSKFNIDTRPNLTYAIYYNEKTKDLFVTTDKKDNDLVIDWSKEDEGYTVIVPPIRKTNNKRGCWRWGVPKLLEEFKNLYFERNTLKIPMFYTKHYLENGSTYKKPKDIFFFHGANGGKTVSELVQNNAFSHPKPVDLMKFLVDRHTNKDAIILDFFAGSGTTGHAVLALNNEDGGRRQFILCTNNENNICEDVTYERLKRVINGYTNSKGEEVVGIGGNLKYFKTGFIEKDQDEEDLKNQFIDKSLELLSIKEDTYEKLIDNDSFKMNGGVDKVIGLYMDIDTNYKLLDDIQGMFDEYNVGVKKLFMPDQIDIDNDSKIEDLRNSGIEIHRVPRKIIDILEGWRK